MRPAVAEIHLYAINANLKNIRKKIGKHPLIMAVVKANAYGHGAQPVTQSIIENGTAQYFGVAIVEEGIELRKVSKKIPILVFTTPMKEQLALFVQHQLEATVCDMEIAKKLNAIARKSGKIFPVHIKIDTGMGRIGVPAEKAVQFVHSVSALSHLFIKGIWTHFASSDGRDLTFSQEQLNRFRSVVTTLELQGIHIPLVHCANSGAIMQMPESYFDMVRPGIMMYGYTPSLETRKTVVLHPALSLKARIGFVKTVAKGTSISYSRRYRTKKKTTIASIPIGYADGYFRTLTGKSVVIIHGKRFPVAGTICMDQIMVDVGNESVSVGDEVLLIGSAGNKIISAWDIAKLVGTIPYEVTCSISQRIPRKYINEK